MNFLKLVDAYGRTIPKGAPPVPIFHPSYGFLGNCEAGRGFRPERGRWASTQAIAKDHHRNVVKALRRLEDLAPPFVVGLFASILTHNPAALYGVIAAISTYDGIVSARGSGALQDVWMSMTATQTPVTLSWYDLMNFASWQPMTAPSITAYVNAATGGAVLDATSNGSWLTNPTGTNKKYIVSVGLSVISITGFSLAMLYDCLWAGSYSLLSNTTIDPTTDVAVTRWASTTPGNADFAGGNMMQVVIYSATLTHTAAYTMTVTYTDQAGVTGKTTISIAPATGPATYRILHNTTHNSATVITSTPFMPLTNAGSSGVTKLQSVQIAGGTVTVGTVYHKIVRPVLVMPFIAANSYIEQDTTLNIGNMPELHNVSQVCGCLGWNLFSAGTTAASMAAFLRMVEG